PPAPREPVLELVAEVPALPPQSPYQLAVRAWFDRWERAGRGKHPTLTGAEGANIKRLVEDLGVEELLAGMNRAFEDPWFLKHGDLLTFAKQRAKFAPPGRPAPRGGADAGEDSGPPLDLTWIERLPEPRRSMARAAWGEKRAEVEQLMAGMRPDAVRRTLADWAGGMRADFERPVAAAGGAR
ncbi:MAG: hypothetical protein NDI82_02265, partial [Anaeromyxobacteraceae bacterium]|nr:hypothetical protein [Anaeromyxobacteraceae bacterium]